MIIGNITHTTKNNFRSTTDAYALSIEAMLETWSRFDFSFLLREDSSTSMPNSDSLDAALLEARIGADPPYTYTVDDSPLSVEWTTQDPVGGNGQYSGIARTVTEIWKSFGVEKARRLNVDPGEVIGGVVIRPGPRYTFLLSGSEYRGYVNYHPAGGVPSMVVIASPIGGFQYPIRLGMHIYSFGSTYYGVENVMVGGALGYRTIYSAANKASDGITDHMHLRIYQSSPRSNLQGFPIDVDT